MYKVVTKDFWGNIITKMCCHMEADALAWKKFFGKNHSIIK